MVHRRRLVSVVSRLIHRLLIRFGGRLPGAALAGLIRQTARKDWPLLAVNLLCSLVLALSEGLTFAVIYQAARLLSAGWLVCRPL